MSTLTSSQRDEPRREYQQRLALRTEARARWQGRDGQLSNARLAVFLSGLGLGVAVLTTDHLHPAVLAAPALVFLALVVLHDRTLARLRRAEEAVQFYQRGLERLDDRWQEHGVQDTSYAPADHPFAADLDLFGPGSLFQLLCTARTRAGEQTLASWLLEPAPAEEVLLRQRAVAELGPLLDLSEDLALLGGGVRAEVRPERLTAWGAAPVVLGGALLSSVQVLRWLLPAAGLVSLGLWAMDGPGMIPFLLIFILEMALHGLLSGRLASAVAGLDQAERDLHVLGELLGRLERQTFHAPALQQLSRVLQADEIPGDGRGAHAGRSARQAIRGLSRLCGLLDSRKNAFFAPLGILLMWSFHFTLAIEAWKRRNGAAVARWLEAVGRFEALGALAAYARENPADPFPELVQERPLFSGRQLGHPLLPLDRCVRNDVHLDGREPIWVVSGSNMSGKSTLLRTVGINAVLAQAGAPVRAESLRLCALQLGATIRIQDSLQQGSSKFYQEIQRLKGIMDLSRAGPALLFLLDEVLHGTNSHDRKQGAMALLEQLLASGAMGLVTTHDLALAEATPGSSGRLKNMHFVDRLEQDRLIFDYKVHPGVVSRSNAIALMRAVGLDV